MKNKQYFIYGGIALAALTAIVIFVKRRGKSSIGGAGWTEPVMGKLTSGFGPRKDPLNKGVQQIHNGQDIAVPIGTKVKAAGDGIVISTTPSILGGNQVVIKHDNGWQTGYAHLSKVLIANGKRVKKGEVIALSGNTGKHTTGAHLHFTMTNPQAQKVDPKKLLYKTA
jgi:murein DD-endopeptidase MepM/ murein hydrolase activator NlpD